MTNADGVAAVTEVVSTYVDAMTRGDRGELERIFFERASEVGHYEGNLLWNSRDAFIRMCEDEGDASIKPCWAIRSLSIHGDIAVVHVQDDWAGMQFDDILTLLQHEGVWRIVSKVYHIRQ
ncbi:MAG: nuclear transport factor 2 family protein [Alphaproteobacteria bacterium]|nr:nuclear transport factor 2 family protein [Alphaproteobacteria bacterium]